MAIKWLGTNVSLNNGNIVQQGFNAFKNWIRGQTGTGLTDAQIASNEYQTEMANTQYQRGVEDMKKAGLNPALMYGQGASPAPSPSGVNVGQPNFDFGQLVQSILLPKQIEEMKARIESIRAEAANKRADTAIKETEKKQKDLDYNFNSELYDIRKQSAQLQNQRQEADIELIKERKNEILQSIQKLIAETENEKARKFLIEAETKFKEAEANEINALLPFKKALMSAQTEAQKAAAAFSTIQAAVTEYKLDIGYFDAEVDELYSRVSNNLSSAEFHDLQSEMQRIKNDIISGKAIDVDSIPKWRFTDRLAAQAWNDFIQHCYQASMAITGPIAGVFK